VHNDRYLPLTGLLIDSIYLPYLLKKQREFNLFHAKKIHEILPDHVWCGAQNNHGACQEIGQGHFSPSW